MATAGDSSRNWTGPASRTRRSTSTTTRTAPLLVAQANDGNLTVPTVLFADGSALTNPSVAEVSRKVNVAA